VADGCPHPAGRQKNDIIDAVITIAEHRIAHLE
jgi:hypothetical protein